ncbi:MAG TPA: secretin N-terminal domain-containing protein [Gammaproteobacteria bacterium]
MRNLFLILTLLCAWTVQAGELKIIQLHNRQADELIPVVQPLLDASDAISGNGYQLIVRTTPQRFAQIEALVQQLDTAPQQLVISVRQNGSSGGSDENYSARGSVGSGRIRMGVDGPSSSRGGSITTYGGNGSGSIRAYHSDSQQSSNLSQRLMVLEGRWATINAGQVVPMQRQTITQTPYGSQVQQTTDYADATSGFDVRPRLNGSEVTLEIAPYRRKLSSGGSGAIDTQSISSTVRGELGEWIEIGGVNETSSGNEGGIGYSSRSEHSDVRSVWLKVELAH